jgi:hypothetical protein
MLRQSHDLLIATANKKRLTRYYTKIRPCKETPHDSLHGLQVSTHQGILTTKLDSSPDELMC